MQKPSQSRFMRAIYRQPNDYTPMWIMRQAGRYLPEYRATRARAGSFMQLCQAPALVREVTLQPLARYALDAAIIFSDILTIPNAMGLGLTFREGEGPQFAKVIRTALDVAALSIPAASTLDYVYESIALVKPDCEVPLLGFCGSPWTLAAYMIEGKSVPGFPTAMALRATDASTMHALLTLLEQSVLAHLLGQIKAGADVVMLFDTWGGLLSASDYQAFSLHYLQKIVAALKIAAPNVPVIVFSKDCGAYLADISGIGAPIIGIDWHTSLAQARSAVGREPILQGNLAPHVLLESPDQIRAQVSQLFADYAAANAGQGDGHIFNLGHGITPDVPPENVSVLVNAVQEFSQPYHQGGVRPYAT